MIKLPVSKNQLVLEIGSGHSPHPRADILCDRFLINDQQRQKRPLVIDRPLVIGIGERLPFKNKSFAFIYCAQVLEHSKKPLLFIKELSRVGKRGLMVMPSIVRERLFGWSYHRWYFWQKGKKLFGVKKNKKENHLLGKITHSLFAKTLWFRRQVSEKERELNIYYFWKNKPQLTVIAYSRQKIKEADKMVEKILEEMEFNWRKDLIFWFNWMWERVQGKRRKIIREMKNNFHKFL